MNRTLTYSKLITACIIPSMIVGCATTINPDVQQAQNLFDKISSDPVVASKAAVALAEAEDSLVQLKQLEDNGASRKTLQRQSYATELKTKIAREKANSAIAKEQIAQAENERKQVLIEARTLEADVRTKQAIEARIKAEKALIEAEEARKIAEEERKKAEDLARQLAELQARPTERGMVLTMGDVLFDYNKADVKLAGMRIVDKLVAFLEKNPERNIQVEGHTDSTGSDQYNLNLSERRADAVKRALIYKGIAANRINAIGYGEEFPIASNATASGQQQNRRVEIVISDEKGSIAER
ncbi:MAG: OmpA family protein [Methylococcales bacterium]|nr:OmpA family protein [Methylococcales bacterium]